MTLAALALALFVQDGIDWAHTWEAALAEAKARNVPIFYTMHTDH